MAFHSHQDVIAKSRLRSSQYGAIPHLGYTDYLEPAKLKIIKDKESQTLREILPYLERLSPMILAQRSMLVLANSEGYIVHSQGDPHFLEHATKVQLMEGAGWHEQVRGTNAIGTAILEKAPVYVLGEEHYSKANQTLYCAASPIFDPSGAILAILDVSGYLGDFHQTVPYIIDGMARQIEDWLLFRHENSRLVFEITDRNHKRYLFAFNNEGQMVGSNRDGRTLNRIHWPDLEIGNETDMRKLFPKHDFEVSVLIDRRKSAFTVPNRKPAASYGDLFCRDETLESALRLAKRAAATDMNVLITGESGTGKELVANFIHQQSERKDGPLIAINCGAMSPTLLHSELFGYEGKAFTGATTTGQMGKFEAADGGTLFLDEIAEMPFDMQVALLRVLQEKIVTRIGGHSAIPVNVRIVAATNRDLWEEVKKERFRLDLYFRLLGVQISLPALRERADKVELAEFVLAKIAQDMNIPVPVLANSTKQKIRSYHFPGNVRELVATLQQGAFLADRGVIYPEHLPRNIEAKAPSPLSKPDALSLKLMEDEAILEAITNSNGNITEACRILGIGRSTLYRKLKKINPS